MASIAAKQVAREVIDTVRKGKKPNLGKIILSKGYSPATATVPSQVTNTRSYQEEIQPVVKQLERLRKKALEALEKKDMDLEDSRVLKELLDSYTKNIQLLSGKATENVATVVNVVDYSSSNLSTPPSIVELTTGTTPPLLKDDTIV